MRDICGLPGGAVAGVGDGGLTVVCPASGGCQQTSPTTPSVVDAAGDLVLFADGGYP